jgi:hypothetical protein
LSISAPVLLESGAGDAAAARGRLELQPIAQAGKRPGSKRSARRLVIDRRSFVPLKSNPGRRASLRSPNRHHTRFIRERSPLSVPEHHLFAEQSG